MSFARDLEEASEAWVRDGLITEHVRRQLLHRHPAASNQSRVVAIIALVGGMVLTAGIFLLVAANWEEISRPAKLGGALVVMVAAFAAGYWVRYGARLRRTGDAMILLGSAAFLGNLALVSQQYNIMANPWQFAFMVFASMVPLLYLVQSRPYAFFTPLAGLVWTLWMMGDSGSRLHADGFPDGLLFTTGVGAGIVAVGSAHRFTRLGHLAAPMEFVGGACFFTTVFILGFYRHDPIQLEPSRLALAVFLGPACILVPAFAGLAAVRLASPRTKAALIAGAAALVATLAICLAVGLHPRDAGERSGEGSLDMLYTRGFWLAFVALSLSLAWLGFVTRRDWWVNAALVAIGVFLMARYFDMFSGTERRGLVFVGAGVLLLAIAAVLEGSRRAIAAQQEEAQ